MACAFNDMHLAVHHHLQEYGNTLTGNLFFRFCCLVLFFPPFSLFSFLFLFLLRVWQHDDWQPVCMLGMQCSRFEQTAYLI